MRNFARRMFFWGITVGIDSMSEKWYLEHMGAMAFWRTVIAVMNITLTALVALKIFAVI